MRSIATHSLKSGVFAELALKPTVFSLAPILAASFLDRSVIKDRANSGTEFCKTLLFGC